MFPEPDLTAELDDAEDIVMGDPDELAESIWALADGVGNAKIAWLHVLTPEERHAFDEVTGTLMRLGGQIRRGVIPEGAR